MKLNDIQHQVLLVPLSRSEKLQKRELDAKCFRKYNYRTGFFDQFLDAWASYCDGTQEDATRMVLNYMAKRFPQMYLEQTDAATNHHVKNEAGELPPNFVSHDGTYDVKWNTRYGDLIQVSSTIYLCKSMLLWCHIMVSRVISRNIVSVWLMCCIYPFYLHRILLFLTVSKGAWRLPCPHPYRARTMGSQPTNFQESKFLDPHRETHQPP